MQIKSVLWLNCAFTLFDSQNEKFQVNQSRTLRTSPQIEPKVRLKSFSQPNPNQATTNSKNQIPMSQSNRESDLHPSSEKPRSIFTPATNIPEASPPSHRIHKTINGHGDEQPPSDHPNDIPPESFVKFVMDKFHNMSLADIKSVLSRLPDAMVKHPDIVDWCAEGAESTMDSINYESNKPIEKLPRDDGPRCAQLLGNQLCASRAAIQHGTVASGQPVMQSKMIVPLGDSNLTRFENTAVNAPDLNIPRNPLDCPISACNNSTVFVSDFTGHIKMNHVRVPVEVLHPQTESNLFVDPTLDDVTQNRCRMMYLVTDKIT